MLISKIAAYFRHYGIWLPLFAVVLSSLTIAATKHLTGPAADVAAVLAVLSLFLFPAGMLHVAFFAPYVVEGKAKIERIKRSNVRPK